MKYESEGLFIGLVSFPFYIDGKELYERVFKDFFKVSHRELYLGALSGRKMDPRLYSPMAYRMFGNFGLAILSLIDDYAFCSRIFNSSHIKVPEGSEHLNKYKSIVLAGSSEYDEAKDRSLTELADDTFLNDGKSGRLRYPFIGIIRIKLDYRLLKNSGNEITRSIKRRIGELKDGQKEQNLASITLDSYDTDELLVVAFSDSFKTLDSFLKEIRRIQLKDLDIANEDVYDPEDLEKIWHVCASCHMSFGYHIDYDFEKEDRETFYKWRISNDYDNNKLIYTINCLIETKPGHRNDFCHYLNSHAKECFGEDDFVWNKTVTGGSIVHVRIPLNRVNTLHCLARGEYPLEDGKVHEDVFKRDIRRIKLTLNESRLPTDTSKKEGHRCVSDNEILISQKDINEIKNRLTRLGVSKIVRERLLSLLDVYNDCGRNKLQTYYFMLLKPAVENILLILKNYEEDSVNDTLQDIESKLNDEISAFETAFYNRMNNKMVPNSILEYGGGVQQFLQAFGFAYKEIVRIISPEEAARNYSLITGVCKESSMRTHAELNINHILYPQLFCVTTWKEASNFSLQLLDDFVPKEGVNLKALHRLYRKKKVLFDTFKHFIHSESALKAVYAQMLGQTEFVRSDSVFGILGDLLTTDTLKYSLQDYIVYHFAFNRDFGLMWRFYMKVFLQTPSIYRRRGEVSRKAFYFILFRLFLVAFREKDNKRQEDTRKFINEQRNSPFDYQLSNLWFECFNKIEKAAETLCGIMNSYAFWEVSEELVVHSEFSLIGATDENGEPENAYLVWAFTDGNTQEECLTSLLNARKKNIRHCVDQIKRCYLDIDSFFTHNTSSPDNTICLMNAFLIAIDELDRKGKKEIVINSLPRRTDGEIDFPMVRKLAQSSSNLLSDPIGGFVIPNPEIRKKYNAYRTLLYRTFWDLSYVSGSALYDVPEGN